MQPYRLKRGVGYCHHKEIKKFPRTKIKIEEIDLESDIESDTRPCTFCGVMLESALPDGDWSTLQPYGGGEVQFHFAFGSTKFDTNFGSTVFCGLICDGCAEKFVKKMEIV